jgi:hypothetical protein
MEHLIVMGGKGHVGSAVTEVLADAGFRVSVLDKGVRPEEVFGDVILHVCIPYSNKFIGAVKAEIKRYSPVLVIVHSTVPVGTTRKLGTMAVHSPVRGQHNDLKSGLRSFTKYVGSQDREHEQKAVKHLVGMGLNVETFITPEETELAKLLCLARYQNDLSYYETAYRICSDFGVSPGIVKRWTASYNVGYADKSFVRPDLEFPHGKIGGHCVMQVSKMLYDQTKNPWLKKNLDLFKGVSR